MHILIVVSRKKDDVLVGHKHSGKKIICVGQTNMHFLLFKTLFVF